jgi:hypothetical protein
MKLTNAEKQQILRAASITWDYVAADAAELGPVDVDLAIELVLDADRIVDIGGLSPKLYEKLIAAGGAVDTWLKRSKRQWCTL